MSDAAAAPLPPLLIAGFGYCGARVASLWGGTVWATARSVDGAERAEATGARGVVASFGDGAPPPMLRLAPGSAPVGLITFGPERSPGAAERDAVAWMTCHGVGRCVYLSSTSVYGDRDGGWVTADTPTAPDTAMGERRVVAEDAFLAACAARGVCGIVLRLPGIVGPGRTPRARFERGDYVYPGDGARWSNRIHVDDIVAAVLLLLRVDAPGGSYLASDGAPFVAIDLVTFIAGALGVPMPRSVPFDALAEQAKPFWAGSRRCDPAKLRALGWAPRYERYTDAYLAAWREEGVALPGDAAPLGARRSDT